jgi:hypothetical protein
MTAVAVRPDAAAIGRLAGEAGVLYERCAALADVALSALESDGISTLAGALRERERVLEQLTPVVAGLAAGREAMVAGATPAERHRLRASLLAVEEAGRRAQAIQARLVARLEERRNEVRRSLDRMRQAGAAREAYARRGLRELRRIDRET